MDNRPIGVFDSGLGGLTVVKEIMDMLPDESLVYFGDNGRTPYGTKSIETVVKYTFQDINFLLSQDVKFVVIACNTASACSLTKVRSKYKIPILEVVGPGSVAAVEKTKNKRTGIIGTAATITSDVYSKAIELIDSDIKTFSKACPLFVNLVEEGWWNNEIAEKIAHEYLKELKAMEIDTLVLGCTHYPLLSKTISSAMGKDVELVSSALELARVLKEALANKELNSTQKGQAQYRYFTSDSPEKFKSLGSKILGRTIEQVEKIDIEAY